MLVGGLNKYTSYSYSNQARRRRQNRHYRPSTESPSPPVGDDDLPFCSSPTVGGSASFTILVVVCQRRLDRCRVSLRRSVVVSASPAPSVVIDGRFVGVASVSSAGGRTSTADPLTAAGRFVAFTPPGSLGPVTVCARRSFEDIESTATGFTILSTKKYRDHPYDNVTTPMVT